MRLPLGCVGEAQWINFMTVAH